MMGKIKIYSLLFFLSASSILAQNTSVREAVESRILGEAYGGVVVVDGIELFSQKELPKFYANRGFEPAWTATKNKNDLIESLESSFDEGLSPEDYHLERIRRLLENSERDKLDHQEQADLDLLMTDALLLYASHLIDGKLEQSDLRKEWDVARNKGPHNPDSLLTITLGNKRIKSVLEELKPNHYMYRLMKNNLKRLRSQAMEGGWPKVSDGETLKPGDTADRIVEVRQFLMAVGDLEKSHRTDGTIFDSALEEAVKNFQRRHRLISDGIIGKGTVEQMQVPVEDRINMLLLNLERTRWIFHEPDDDFLLVNIAGFHVKRIKNRKEVFDSRVIVGKYNKETPVFKGLMEYIVLNPTWTLPYSIATHETLPRLKRDTGYLSTHHMEVLDRKGEIVDPAAINWNQYSAGNFPFVIRQKAGPWNALGQVKFIFPNKYAVYLHDTPSRVLFNRQDRAFSHGCIRTEDKWGLFMSLMNDQGEWNQEKINKILDSGKTVKIDLPKPIHIYLVYFTAAVDEKNNLLFMKDVYKRDESVLKALKKPVEFRKVD